MNAITGFVADGGLSGTIRPPADALGGVGAAPTLQQRVRSSTEKPGHRDRPARIPVFRDGKARGFIERADIPTVRAAVACNGGPGLPPDIRARGKEP